MTRRPGGRVFLLDVNVLVALFLPSHVHHEVAHEWFADRAHDGWATCPITENGFLRVVLNQPGSDIPLRPRLAVDHLRRFCAGGGHHYWPDAVSLRDSSIFQFDYIAGPRQFTDVYLLGLAHKMGGRLATFDRGIPIKAIIGARKNLVETIGSDEAAD
jgi:toxin-antitoxin system PIN domain toxin